MTTTGVISKSLLCLWKTEKKKNGIKYAIEFIFNKIYYFTFKNIKILSFCHDFNKNSMYHRFEY